ncbi:MAG: LemA family protein [Candidatus Nanoarchaeia archaeon]|nr:LemA family protein [Candidatus Haiyanarchaeum thermophilum]MCW1303029.1 LemA family protein [Candidatus Haiyanarchaeum thermophilum]MCW1303707.1 LemA family protein [Candidatus Haiyanarchaeum thermophilum]MCW1306387.1 LemA family protein [Candidatus Haiyanarchaeum thermophilum]MCW1307103.1 LemA family protein [Candidatus Haiyanarchaeum thermophilum]
MGLELLLWILIGIVALICILLFIFIYNNFVRLKKNIEKAWANIDVILKQRHDELPKLIEVCKGYMQYEKSVLEELTKLRTQWMSATTTSERARISDQISKALKELFAVAENYPQLKADETFKHLQVRISGLENELADRREFYNDCVATFNTRLESIPDKWVGKLMKLKPFEFFKVSEEEKRDVEIKLT